MKTQIDIQEGNRLIAEFITDEPDVLKNDLEKAGTVESMQYHTSWDWLMPVVERCREKQIFGSQRLISNIDKRLLKLDLLGTFKNVIEFIEWYNKNNKT